MKALPFLKSLVTVFSFSLKTVERRKKDKNDRTALLLKTELKEVNEFCNDQTEDDKLRSTKRS